MSFLLGLTLPSTYAGSSTPSFDSTVVKNGLVELTAGNAACTTCAVALDTPGTNAVNV